MDSQNIIYSKPTCPYCVRAKALLTQLNIPFTEVQIQNKPALREEMISKAGHYTVPQIFLNDTHIGGCDDLYAMHKLGKLEQYSEIETV
jgi:glutaredoxin 3